MDVTKEKQKIGLDLKALFEKTGRSKTSLEPLTGLTRQQITSVFENTRDYTISTYLKLKKCLENLTKQP